jgi:hypothetical protein
MYCSAAEDSSNRLFYVTSGLFCQPKQINKGNAVGLLLLFCYFVRCWCAVLFHFHRVHHRVVPWVGWEHVRKRKTFTAHHGASPVLLDFVFWWRDKRSVSMTAAPAYGTYETNAADVYQYHRPLQQPQWVGMSQL